MSQVPKFQLRFFNRDVEKEYKSLDPSTRSLVDIGYRKLQFRADEIGKPLGGKLAGCKELKFRKAGIRIIFRIGKDSAVEIVDIVAIGKRERGRVFDIANLRLNS